MPLALIRFYVAGQAWLADLSRPIVLAHRMRFGPEADSWLGIPPPSSEVYSSGGFVGSVPAGGSVNVSMLTIAPHGVGTHTEGPGHLTHEPLPVEVSPGLSPATLSTVSAFSRDDALRVLETAPTGFTEAIILRAAVPLPLTFEPEAMQALATAGVEHLIVEQASVDPESDGGRLSAHRAFWGLKPGETSGSSARTITELAVLPGDLPDGPYLLNLQAPNLETDAVPSRPVIYNVRRVL